MLLVGALLATALMAGCCKDDSLFSRRAF